MNALGTDYFLIGISIPPALKRASYIACTYGAAVIQTSLYSAPFNKSATRKGRMNHQNSWADGYSTVRKIRRHVNV